MCSHRSPIVKPQPECSCGLPWLFTVVRKDSFESYEAGLLTSSNANKAEVCACLPKPLKRQYGLTDDLKTWTVWLDTKSSNFYSR